MSTELDPDTIVAERYVLQRILGRGGFSNTYLAYDELADRQVVLKELCPPGSSRAADTTLLLPDTSQASAHRTIYQFLREAKLLAKLRLPGVIQIYDAFQWGGTVYASMEFFPEAVTLERILRAEGPLDSRRTRLVLIGVAEALAEIHRQGYLHRDIKPSNILLLPGDEVVLIDFGAAREWQADATVSHTALFTPGYAPIEQLSESGRRGPATDIYALAATGYEMLTGIPPTSSVDRVGGAPVRDLSTFRGDIPLSLAAAILKGLALRASDRPQSADEFIELLHAKDALITQEAQLPLEKMDIALAALDKMRFRKNECPGCGELLEQPKPLKQGVCPVCRDGRVKPREFEEKRCAVCRAGLLQKERNYNPMSRCPLCKYSRLQKRGVIGRKSLHCAGCGAEFTIPARGEMTLVSFGKVRSALVEEGQTAGEGEFWLPLSERSEIVLSCESCHAEWDEESDGRLTLAHAQEDPLGIAKKYKMLTLAEWARVAARLPLDAGTHSCDSCGADCFIDGDGITLIDAEKDYYGFLARYQGRRLNQNQLPWLAVGKTSGQDGIACGNCETEFDISGSYLRLRNTTNRNLSPYVEQARLMEDWHRLARCLPTRDEEPEFRSTFEEMMRSGLITGALPWDEEKDIRWQGAAQRVEEDGSVIAKGQLQITHNMFSFSARGKSVHIPLDAIISAAPDEGLLRLRAAGQSEQLLFSVSAVDLRVEMESGNYLVLLSVADCAEAITNAKHEIGAAAY